MGREYPDKKIIAEFCTKLSISMLKQQLLLNGYCCAAVTWTDAFSGNKKGMEITVDVVLSKPYARLRYVIPDKDGKNVEYDYEVALTTTNCNFGGIRYWFICPLMDDNVPCGKRVETLYLLPDGKYFGCRNCYNLSYDSRNTRNTSILGIFKDMVKGEMQLAEYSCGRTRWQWKYKGETTRKAKKLSKIATRVQICKNAFEWYQEKRTKAVDALIEASRKRMEKAKKRRGRHRH